MELRRFLLAKRMVDILNLTDVPNRYSDKEEREQGMRATKASQNELDSSSDCLSVRTSVVHVVFVV